TRLPGYPNRRPLGRFPSATMALLRDLGAGPGYRLVGNEEPPDAFRTPFGLDPLPRARGCGARRHSERAAVHRPVAYSRRGRRDPHRGRWADPRPPDPAALEIPPRDHPPRGPDLPRGQPPRVRTTGGPRSGPRSLLVHAPLRRGDDDQRAVLPAHIGLDPVGVARHLDRVSRGAPRALLPDDADLSQGAKAPRPPSGNHARALDRGRRARRMAGRRLLPVLRGSQALGLARNGSAARPRGRFPRRCGRSGLPDPLPER